MAYAWHMHGAIGQSAHSITITATCQAAWYALSPLLACVMNKRCAILSKSSHGTQVPSRGLLAMHDASLDRQLTSGRDHRVWEPSLDPPALLSNVCCVLVAPRRPLTVGTVARSCSAFECQDLRIVQPRQEYLTRYVRMHASARTFSVEGFGSTCQLAHAYPSARTWSAPHAAHQPTAADKRAACSPAAGSVLWACMQAGPERLQGSAVHHVPPHQSRKCRRSHR